MSLFEKLTDDMKTAMKSGDKDRLSTIRLLRGQLKDYSINTGKELDAEAELGILAGAAKKRRESIKAYGDAGRDDLVEKETKELNVIEDYLPKQLTKEELVQLVEEAIAATGAQTMQEMGKLMGYIMPKVKGRADGNQINEIVKEKLS